MLNKINSRLWLYLMGVTFLLILSGCTKEKKEEEVPELPTVFTAEIGSISSTSASAGGSITNDGRASVTARGVCWSTTPNPTIAGSKTADGAGTGSFTSSIDNLSANTVYYVRAYATNSVGTGYGQERSFTTPGAALAEALLSYWKFDETTGTTAADALGSSGLNFVNGPVWFSPGKKGNAIDFGTTSMRYLEKTSVFSGNKNTYTLAGWIYLDENVDNDAPNPWMHIMGMNSGNPASMGAGAAEVKISLIADNKLQAMYHTLNGANHGTDDVMLRESTTPVTLKKWHHVVGVINNGTIDLYIDGVIDNSKPVEGSGLNTNLAFSHGRITVGNARFWQASYVTSRWFRGKMDEVGIWDRALGAKDVEALYNSGNAVSYPF